MTTSLNVLQAALAFMIGIGSCIWAVAALCACFFRRRKPTWQGFESWPPVTLLKPVYGLEKNLEENLRTACLQDYPEYQVLYSVQRPDDPAIPVLQRLAREFGPERVTLAVESAHAGMNGKINNLVGAMPHARHELLVISDSDVRLQPDYLRTIVAPLADPEVGGVSTYFRATDAGPWYERMELLTLNADHFAMALFGNTLRLADFCFGASTALSKQMLARIGGFEALGDYLVEDNEMGRRILQTGKRLVVMPYLVDTMVDLKSASAWWRKQTYWDQNTKAAIPVVFAISLVVRTIPLALLFVLLRAGDTQGWAALGVALAVRLCSAWIVLGVGLRSVAGLRSSWLIPIKDVLSLFWFVRAYLERRVTWRGVEMALTRDGRLFPLESERSP